MAKKPQIPNIESRHNYDRSFGRAYDVRRDDDTFYAPKVSIYDVDYAVLWWLTNYIKPQVIDNDRKIDVPVMYANGDLWSQIKQHGYMRGSDGKLQAPLITVRRLSMMEDQRFPKLEGNRTPFIGSPVRYKLFPYKQINNTYERPGENKQKSQTYFLTAIPEYYKVSYEILIWTDLQEQLNEVVHEVIVTSHFAWGDAYKFTTTIQDVSFETIKTIGEDRLVRASIPIEVDAILMKDFEARQSTLQKAYSLKRVRFANEREQPDFILYDEQGNPAPNHISREPYDEIAQRNYRNIRYPQQLDDKL